MCRRIEDSRILYSGLLALAKLALAHGEAESGAFFLSSSGRMMDETGAQRTAEYDEVWQECLALEGPERAQQAVDRALGTETERVLDEAEQWLSPVLAPRHSGH